MPKPPEYYTVTQAALFKKVSRTTVYSAIENKVLKAEKQLGRTVISHAALSAWHPVRGWQGGQLSVKHKKAIAAGQKKRWARKEQKGQQD